MKWVNRLFIFFLGIILTITTGFGIAAFYPQPVTPTFPTERFPYTTPQSCNTTPEAQNSPECQKIMKNQEASLEKENLKRQQYDKEMENFRNVNAGYTRTAVFLGIVIGALFAILGLTMIKKSRLIATGLLLSSVLTAITTRLLIGLASLGSSVTGSSMPDTLALVEFGALLLLSIAVIVVGLINLKDD